jgi:succinoglycan biosynthesis protein ExoL
MMPPRNVAYFNADNSDPNFIRHVRAIERDGWRVHTYSFSRGQFGQVEPPDWDACSLGGLYSGNLRRWLSMIRGVWRAVRRSREVGRLDVFVGRNLDMALLALAVRRLSHPGASLVYVVLDVHAALVGSTLRARCGRWLERLVLREADVLAVSSEDFLTGYFFPVQGYEGDVAVVENRVSPAAAASQLRAFKRIASPWTIVVAGSLRCEESLNLLKDASERLGGRLHVQIFGTAGPIGARFLDQLLNSSSFITFGGPYRSPYDLQRVYTSGHLAWCIDLRDAGHNSHWLLPNRAYESAFCGVPSIALKGTATARFVELNQTGYVLENATVESLVNLIAAMDVKEWGRRTAGILRRRADFVEPLGVWRFMDRLPG